MAHTDHDSHHIIPFKILIRVFGALVFLTVLTVATARLDLGSLDLPVALAIAGVKATLVVLFFMALKYDKGVNTMIFTVGTVFVFVFLLFTLLDVTFRGDLGNVATETISAEERRIEALEGEEPADSLLRVTPADYARTPAAGGASDTASAQPEDGAAAGGTPDAGTEAAAGDGE